MGGMDVLVAIALLIAFIGGALIGVITIVSFASRREDRLYSLTGRAPGPACQGARVLTGAGVRGSGFLSSGLRSGPVADEDTLGQEPNR